MERFAGASTVLSAWLASTVGGSVTLFAALALLARYAQCVVLRDAPSSQPPHGSRARLVRSVPAFAAVSALPLILFDGDAHVIGRTITAVCALWWANSRLFALACGRAPGVEQYRQRFWPFFVALTFPVVVVTPPPPAAKRGRRRGDGGGGAHRSDKTSAARARRTASLNAGQWLALGAAKFAGIVLISKLLAWADATAGGTALPAGVGVHHPVVDSASRALGRDTLANDALLALGLYWFASLIMDLPAALALILCHDFTLGPHFDYPFLSASLREFWSVRWNMTASGVLRDSVFAPVAEGRLVCAPDAPTAGARARAPPGNGAASKPAHHVAAAAPRQRVSRARLALATVAAFTVSGIMHEIVLYVLSGELTLQWFAFFALNGVATVCDALLAPRAPRPLRRVLALLWLATSARALFFAAPKRNGLASLVFGMLARADHDAVATARLIGTRVAAGAMALRPR